MIEKTLKIINERGLHVRPSTLLSDAARKRQCRVTVRAHGKTINVESMLLLVAAHIEKGEEITLVCDGPDEDAAMEEASELIESGFNGLF